MRMNKKPGKHCLSCNTVLPTEKRRNKYCDNVCQGKYEASEYIKRWLNGDEDGMSGKDGISKIIRNYLFNKYYDACELCGWSKLNPHTNKIPLTIHHIDGDHTNNKESNLQLLCPNCHSLTENYGPRNKNSKRSDRRANRG